MKIVHCVFLFLCFSCARTNLTNDGVALFLSPLINSGKINEARNASRVYIKGFEYIEGYSGYITVDERYDSNLFFFFTPSQSDKESDPIILRLQGGPGLSDCIGFFGPNGPLILTKALTLASTDTAWIKNHSVIYMDNPVGTGYSFTNPDGHAQNETLIAEHVYSLLLQFFQLFPEMQKNDFFVVGESYGAKYATAVSYAIHKNNPLAKQKINLKGIAFAGGLLDPLHQQNYGSYLQEIGLIDANQRKLVDEYEQQVVESIQKEQWLEAFATFDNFIIDTFNKSTLFKNLTGYDYYYNYLQTVDPSESFNYIFNFAQSPEIRAAIHIGDKPFNSYETVLTNLKADFMQSVAPWLSELACSYRILLYTGQLDIVINHSSIVNFLDNFSFCHADAFKKAPKHQWHVKGRLAGYFKQAGNLADVLVLNAGHLLSYDQPAAVLDLITRFTRNQPLM